MSKDIPIPLVGSFMAESNTIGTKPSQFFGNCFFNILKNDVTGKGSVQVYPRPSIRNQAAFSATITSNASTRGCYYWQAKDATYGIWGVKLFRSATGALPSLFSRPGAMTNISSSLSTDNAANGGFQFEEFYDGSNYFLLMKDDGGNLYSVDTSDNVVQVSDGDYTNLMGFGAAVGPVVVLDGRVYALAANGNIGHSDLNSYTAWTAGNYIAAQQWLDGGVCLIKKGNLIGCFGTFSLEWFQNVGNASGSVLGRVVNLASKTGCANHRTVKYMGDTVYWVGKGQDVGLGVFRLKDYTPERISTPDVERLIQGATQSAGGFKGNAAVFNASGHLFYVFSFDDSNGPMSLAFDATTGQWHPWFKSPIDNTPLEEIENNSATNGPQLYNYLQGNASTTLGSTDTVSAGISVYQPATGGGSTGYIYLVSNLQSGATSIDHYPTIQIGPLSLNGGMGWSHDYMRIMGENGQWKVSTSDNGCATFTNRGTIDLSGNNSALYRLGSSKQRYVRLECVSVTGKLPVISELHFGVTPSTI